MNLIKHCISLFVFTAWLFISQAKAQTVYITDSGKKYHAKNCDKVKTGKKGIDVSAAKKQGYQPCKFCKTDSELVADKPKDKKEVNTK